MILTILEVTDIVRPCVTLTSEVCYSEVREDHYLVALNVNLDVASWKGAQDRLFRLRKGNHVGWKSGNLDGSWRVGQLDEEYIQRPFTTAHAVSVPFYYPSRCTIRCAQFCGLIEFEKDWHADAQVQNTSMMFRQRWRDSP